MRTCRLKTLDHPIWPSKTVELLASYSNTAPQVVELFNRVNDLVGQAFGDGAPA
jgi:hypothetical protein